MFLTEAVTFNIRYMNPLTRKHDT